MSLPFNLGFSAHELRRIEQMIHENQPELREAWRDIHGTQAGEPIKAVRLTEDTLSVDLIDGRTISGPLASYPRLLHATPEQRANWHVAGGGYGIH